jgi:hypothetical protein
MVVGDVSDVCVIHDRHKGILQAINDIKEGSEERNRAAQWPDVHSRWCMRHVGGIRNRAFRMPKCEITSVSQARSERLSSETSRAIESISLLRILLFDLYLSSPVVRPSKLNNLKVLKSWFGRLVFPATKPRERILPSQPVITWVSPGGFHHL